MHYFNYVFMLILLYSSMSLSNDLPLKKQFLSENVMIISTEFGSGPQIVIAAEKGILLMNSLWGVNIAARYRAVVQETLGRKDFAYIINSRGRLDLVGGNAIYPEAEIVAHEITYNNLQDAKGNLDQQLRPLIEMWRRKAGLSKERLDKYVPDSEDEKSERSWYNFCQQVANDLSTDYNLRLPTIILEDSLTLDLGDRTIELYSFGKASFEGGLVFYVPEERMIFTGFLFTDQHLIPTPNSSRAKLDVPRWLYVLDKLLHDNNQVEKVICGSAQIQTKEWLIDRRNYIRELWQKVRTLNSRGLDLAAIQDYLSIDKTFTHLRNWDTWKISSAERVTEEHRRNVQLFWAQLQDFASDLIEVTIQQKGIHAAIKQYYELKGQLASDYYFDELSFNALGYKLLNQNKILEATTIFKLNVDAFPQSSNVYDSLAEAYMRSGNTELAILNYRKSLQFNPDNSNAKRMLDKLESGN
jgi:tetratricopeptide (TPR) repeat protein